MIGDSMNMVENEEVLNINTPTKGKAQQLGFNKTRNTKVQPMQVSINLTDNQSPKKLAVSHKKKGSSLFQCFDESKGMHQNFRRHKHCGSQIEKLIGVESSLRNHYSRNVESLQSSPNKSKSSSKFSTCSKGDVIDVPVIDNDLSKEEGDIYQLNMKLKEEVEECKKLLQAKDTQMRIQNNKLNQNQKKIDILEQRLSQQGSPLQFAKYPTQPNILDTEELTEKQFLDSASNISVEQNLLLRSRPRLVEKLSLDLVVEQTCEKDTLTPNTIKSVCE